MQPPLSSGALLSDEHLTQRFVNGLYNSQIFLISVHDEEIDFIFTKYKNKRQTIFDI